MLYSIPLLILYLHKRLQQQHWLSYTEMQVSTLFNNFCTKTSKETCNLTVAQLQIRSEKQHSCDWSFPFKRCHAAAVPFQVKIYRWVLGLPILFEVLFLDMIRSGGLWEGFQSPLRQLFPCTLRSRLTIHDLLDLLGVLGTLKLVKGTWQKHVRKEKVQMSGT